MIDEFELESLESRRKRMRVQMLYKILNNVNVNNVVVNIMRIIAM